MKSSKLLLTAAVLTGLGIGTAVLAQQQHGMQMKDGMKPSQMQQGGMMDRGSRGMMGGGMMGRGMMGHMMQGGMMGRNCPMMGMMMGESDGSTHTAGRIAFLKAELGITDEQQAAFDDYAAALKKNFESMQQMRSSMMSRMQATTVSERFDAHLTAMESRLEALKQVKPALDKLYAALSDEQKKKADEVLTGMGCMM